jgi:hypothetical protein
VTTTEPATTRRRRLTRTGPLAWLLGGFWAGMSALFIGLSAEELPGWSVVVGTLAVALVVRMSVMGVYADGAELRCVSWLVTPRVPCDEVTAVRVVGYSGFGNMFSDSRMLSMLVVERRSGRPVVLRGTFSRPSTAKRAARSIEDEVVRSREPSPAASGCTP